MLKAKPEDKYLYLLMGKFIATGELDQAYEEVIENGKKKGPQMALSVLRCLNENDEGLFLSSLGKYLTHFKKHEFSNKYLNETVSYIGTIMYYLGKKHGYIFDLSSPLCAYIIKPLK